jgi:hypothetical protein
MGSGGWCRIIPALTSSGLEPSAECQVLCRVEAVLPGVAVALWSSTAGPMHATYPMTPHGRRLTPQPRPLRPGMAS